MKKYLFLLVALIFSVLAFAQKNIIEDKDLQQRVYSLPYYSYGKGLGFTSPDSIYQMNIRFRMQSRATYNQNEDEDATIDGQIRRLRLRLDGYVGDPRFTYALQLSFSPGDLGGSIQDGENLQIIRDAVVFYSINKRWSVGFGQTKLPGNRQRVNSSGGLQLTDRSINNALFNIDRDFGIQLNYIYQEKNQFSYNLKGAISQGEGRNITANDDAHLAYTGKVELYPFGSFKRNGEYFEGDILREQTPKLMLSAAYQFNNKAKRAQGQQGTYLYEKKDLHSFFADAILKYNGFAFMAAFMQRSTDNAIAYNPEDLSQFNYVMAGKGMDYQASYAFTNNLELIGRYSWQKMDEQIAAFRPDAQQYSLGLTKYFWEHAFKIQAEATYNVQDYFNSMQKNSWYFRFQVEMGI